MVEEIKGSALAGAGGSFDTVICSSSAKIALCCSMGSCLMFAASEALNVCTMILDPLHLACGIAVNIGSVALFKRFPQKSITQRVVHQPDDSAFQRPGSIRLQ